MARTTAEIKKTMTDAFMADADLREAYGLAADATWDKSFSAVSVENVLLYVVAACCRVLEVLMEQWVKDVDTVVEKAVVASVPWYWKKALAYQKGDALVLNEDTMEYGYATTDEEKQVVKYAAVRDKGRSVQILVSGDDGTGSPAVLDDETLAAFKQYMNRVKVAGVMLNISSKASDKVKIKATVTIDPLVLNEEGETIDGGERTVETAIEEHLKDIAYGGTLNKTRLLQAMLSAEGVEDVDLETVEYTRDGGTTWVTLTGNNYTGESGSYVATEVKGGLTYVV